MAKYVRVGEDLVTEEDAYRLMVSGEFLVVGSRYLPTWLELELEGYDEPNTFGRVEVRDGAPRVVQFGFISREGQREIRQKDLREVQVGAVIEDVYAGFVIEVRDGKGISNWPPDTDHDRSVRDFLYASRLDKGKRPVTAELLVQVANVYRANIDKAPTEAVARTFGVKSRMASNYVQRARERGLLPPTSQGKKKA